MKITVYTTTDCQFSKQEREYLASHNLQYEEKNLETNKEFLTEMLAISNNFAGTPVTRIEKDDGTITVLKGFTKEEFDGVFGFNTPKTEEAKPTETPPPTAEVQASPTPPQPEETLPPTESLKQSEQQTPAPPTETTMPADSTNTTSTNPTEPTPPVDEKLESVLDKLEEETEKTEKPAIPSTETPTEASSSLPPADAPTIPDFSSDNQTIQSDK